ncbi:MAG: OmpA family protein, partial [Planctomycetes bacterium]|nr:OmpA family protein [Planctomycetota bacterium]
MDSGLAYDNGTDSTAIFSQIKLQSVANGLDDNQDGIIDNAIDPEDTAAGGAGAGAGVGRGLTTKPGSQEDLVVNVGDRVFFEFDKYNLKADARKTLQRQTVWLKKYPANAITVQGHCDERGTREYNLAL